MRRILAALFASALLALGASPHAADAQVVPIPRSSVAMAVPQGFRIASKFAGLENPATGSTITVAEYPPEQYSQLAAVFASPKTASTRFAAEGTRITRIDQVTLAAGQAPLAIGSQEDRGRDVTKFIALLGGPETRTNSVVITFNLMRGSSLGRSDVDAVVRSVKLTRIPTLEEKLSSLPFTFDTAAPFHVADVLPGNTALITSYEGQDPSGDKPVMLIARVATSASPAETAQTAEKAVRNMGGFRDAQIKEQAPVMFAGGEGRYIVAIAGQRTMLQFLRVVSGGSYIRLVARGETGALEQTTAAVKTIADSVRLRD